MSNGGINHQRLKSNTPAPLQYGLSLIPPGSFVKKVTNCFHSLYPQPGSTLIAVVAAAPTQSSNECPSPWLAFRPQFSVVVSSPRNSTCVTCFQIIVRIYPTLQKLHWSAYLAQEMATPKFIYEGWNITTVCEIYSPLSSVQHHAYSLAMALLQNTKANSNCEC